MLQITEDTPPDMLAGAMDLTVHLPTGRAVKMAVERSTPMMDLLVQITTNHHLQLSNYTLQALGMAPSSEHSDKILPYKPNTPIGTLDTQHIRVVSKSRTLPVPKNIPPGHQPFESTFRLKVHLPRNQLYVTRVSRNVFLEDIMKKVCEEKNLDPVKYELKHPGNLDEVLDPKLTLSDYQITEIYVVLKGTASLNQAFSTNDIMALRKEEERKQMHNKTGGGVFNLIFRRGKSSMGSGSISSDTRSISPTHSDDSRSVTPPAVPQPILAPPKKDPPQERPKPPQRKRRPAPKPPNPNEDNRRNNDDIRGSAEDTRRNSEDTRRNNEDNRRNSEEKPPSTVSEVNELQTRKAENGLTICHSRNSSDSSGYHEASVLSDNCNTSLPRRPKSAFVSNGDMEKISKMHSQSTTNLSKMSFHSKSTTSLGIAGRKKKAAPPPPPAIRASNPAINIETPSNVVASQPASTQQESHLKDEIVVAPPNIVPLPRTKLKMASKDIPKPSPRHDKSSNLPTLNESPVSSPRIERTKIDNNTIVEEIIKENIEGISNEPLILHKEQAVEEERISKSKPDETNNVVKENVKEPEFFENKKQVQESKIEPDISEVDLKDSLPLVKNETLEEPIYAAVVKEVKSEKMNTPEHNSNILVVRKKENNSRELDKNDLEKQTKHPLEAKPIVISQIQKQTHFNIFTSPEFLGPKKPPEIIAVIPKTPEQKNIPFDYTRKTSNQSRMSLTEPSEGEIASLRSRQSTESYADGDTSTYRTSISSAVESLGYTEDLSDIEGSSIRKRSLYRDSILNHMYGIGNLEYEYRRTDSVTSLRSLQSLPGFFNTGGLKKWNNFEDLDDMSLAYVGPSSMSVVDDQFDETESFSSQQALDSLASITSCPSNIAEVKKENHFFGSTDSGIAQESAEKLSEIEDSRIITPPPPPLLDESLPDTIVPPPPLEETVKDILEIVTDDTNASPIKANEEHSSEKELIEITKEKLPSNEEVTPVEDKIDNSCDERLKEPSTTLSATENIKEDEIDWQYQLPSPPKAFRDQSPMPESVNSDSQSVADCKDSVVTSPELFEKLKSIEDNQSEKGTLISSELSSVVSEEEKPLCNNLSLENLEKRKSLVYNRELSTSLKMTDNLMQIQTASEETFSTSLSTFESTFVDLQQSSHKREITEPKYVQKPITTNTLPNFKISTYDKPKQKIKVFEDDTIRSNTDNFTKISKATIENSAPPTTKLSKSFFRRSMENISYRKNSFEDQFKVPKDEVDHNTFRVEATPMPKNFGPMSSIFRSESFSTETHWSPSKPVSRSKSYLALNGNSYKEETTEQTEKSMSRSNSLYDVSGLQSLGVMRLIQNKLSTPTPSMENVSVTQHERFQKAFTTTEQPTKDNPLPPKPPQPEEPPKPIEKVYKYRGPPSVNMGTWSDRPKIPVSVKEDADYKLGNNVSSKLIVNTTNNNITSNNTIEVKRSTNSIKVNGYDQQKSNSVSIKINGTEPVHTREKSTGNVIIKIGSLNPEKPKMIDNQRFINHTTATGYRKPFSTINNNQNQRPHSIAFGSDFDISRVPVVRSVELKKPYKEMGNTSVTHIYQPDNFRSDISNSEPVSELKLKFNDLQRNNNTLDSKYNSFSQDKDSKPVMRVSSFKPFGATPVVRGFKSNEPKVNVNRFSWNTSSNFNTLPVIPREKDTYHTNSQVPFSQSTLRRTESSKLTPEAPPTGVQSEPDSPVHSLMERNSFSSLPHVTKTEIKPPPPPPLMPKVILKKTVHRPAEPTLDQRDQLLSAIRNFGGKKGLKSVKV